MEHEAAKYADVSGSFAYWTSTKSTNMCKARSKPLFGSLNVLFGAVQVAIHTVLICCVSCPILTYLHMFAFLKYWNPQLIRKLDKDIWNCFTVCCPQKINAKRGLWMRALPACHTWWELIIALGNPEEDKFTLHQLFVLLEYMWSQWSIFTPVENNAPFTSLWHHLNS